MEQNKERYRKLCEEKNIPLFMQACWLDAVCTPDGKQWDVLLCEGNGKIIGTMPYHLSKKWGFKMILQPQLTQYNGIWIDYPEDIKLYKRYSFEKQVIDNLIDQLESLKVSYYSQNFYHTFTNWQPFYWRGFRQTTRYTYVLKNIENTDMIFDNIHPQYRQKLRKSEKELIVDHNLSPEDFYQFHKKSLTEKNDRIVYSKQLWESVYQAAIKREQGKIIAIRDKNNNLLSAVFFVWNMDCGYNLITARKINDGSNNTSVFMIWEVIKYLKNKTRNYDFEGSMIKGVAKRNQYLGAEQIPYFNISKSYSSIFAALQRITNKKI